MGVCNSNKIKRNNALASLRSERKEVILNIDKGALILQEEGSYTEYYDVQKTLGEGSFGKVVKVIHKQTGQARAMKIIDKVNSDYDLDIKNEIDILKTLDHPNIVKIFECFITQKYYYVITELCGQGELYEDVVNHKQSNPYREEPAAYIMHQILSALYYCHTKNVIHRDLKPENILIEKKDMNDYHKIKIIDFGTAKIFEKNTMYNKVIGSSYYMAPEVLNCNYNEKCDLWSCGVILYILLSLSPPFPGGSSLEIQNRIKSGLYDITSSEWDDVSAPAKSLIEGLLKMNVDKRITAENALKHEWFRVYSTKESTNILNEVKIQSCLNNIYKYEPKKILQQAALAYLVHNNLHYSQVQDAVRLFNLIDTNNDGQIIKDEFIKGISKYIKDNKRYDLDKIFLIIDADNNDYIEYEEFVRAAIDKSIFTSDEFLQFAFRFFDKDKNGEITIDEFRKVFFKDSINSEKINDVLKIIIEEVDLDGDGVISYSEFKTIMKNILDS
jgi:calcium-dependent protein kinase